MRKFVAKLFLASAFFTGRSKQIDWFRTIAIFSTVVTIGLVGLYIWAHHAN